MSLICIMCGEIIVMSNNPDHYSVCSACPISELTPEQRAEIESHKLNK